MNFDKPNLGKPCPCEVHQEKGECKKHNRIWKDGKLLQLAPYYFEQALYSRQHYYDINQGGIWITEQELEQIYKISDKMNMYDIFGSCHLDEEAGNQLKDTAKSYKARLNILIDKILQKYGADSRSCVITNEGQILLKTVIDPTWVQDESHLAKDISI